MNYQLYLSEPGPQSHSLSIYTRNKSFCATVSRCWLVLAVERYMRFGHIQPPHAPPKSTPPARDLEARCCNDIFKYWSEHGPAQSDKTEPNCYVCGCIARSSCTKCGVPLCTLKWNSTRDCYVQYHDTECGRRLMKPEG